MFRIGDGHGGLSANGYSGVAFFFILSGFVLTWTFDFGVGKSTFYFRRAARIFPNHLVTSVAALVVILITHQLIAPKQSVLSLLLVQTWTNPQFWQGLNSVSWSLADEMAFYLALPFALPFLSRLRSRWLAAVVGGFWIVTSVATAYGAGTSLELFVYVNPIIRSSEFFLGAALALMVSRGWRLNIGPLMAAAIVAAVYVGIWPLNLNRPLPDVFLAIPFSILIVAAATADFGKKRSWFRARWLVYAGEVSFAFYLVHVMVLDGVRRWWPDMGPVVFAGSALALSALAAVALHHGIERPCQRGLRSLERQARASRRPSQVSGSSS